MRTIECETCNGTGEAMAMVCYGGPPIETMDTCPDCKGTGEIEVPDLPKPNQWQEWLAVRAQIEGRQ